MELKNILIEVFNEAGHELPLEDIYTSAAKKITRPVFDIYYGDGPYKDLDSFKSTVRNALQDNSSDSKNFHRGNGEDLFKKVNPDSKDGLWNIR